MTGGPGTGGRESGGRAIASAGDTGNYQVRALERGLRILCAFTAARPELGLQDLYDVLDISKPTLVRLLSVLKSTGFVEADENSGRYRLGIKAFEVGGAYVSDLPLEQMALPYLRQLTEHTEETASLAVLDGTEVVHLAVVEPNRPLRFHTRVGFRDAAYCTALGKVLLAHLSTAVLRGRLRRKTLPRRTPATITAVEDLLAELDTVRRVGWAEDREEDIPGLRCLGAPVRNASGATVAAVSVSGPAAEFVGAGRAELLRHLLSATGEMSKRLGYTTEGHVPEDLSAREG